MGGIVHNTAISCARIISGCVLALRMLIGRVGLWSSVTSVFVQMFVKFTIAHTEGRKKVRGHKLWQRSMRLQKVAAIEADLWPEEAGQNYPKRILYIASGMINSGSSWTIWFLDTSLVIEISERRYRTMKASLFFRNCVTGNKMWDWLCENNNKAGKPKFRHCKLWMSGLYRQ